MANDWEPVNCLLCGQDNAAPLVEGPDRLHNLPGTFRLVRCRHCGLIYQNPRPSPTVLAGYYPDDYPPHVVGKKPTLWGRLDIKLAYAKRIRALRRFSTGGRLLDIGCGTGGFLRAVSEGGWEVYGLEPSVRAAKVAAEVCGAPVITARLEDADVPPEFFDVVTLWDVLEHLHDPRAGLAKASRTLKAGGLLVVSTPDFDSPDRKLFGKYWFGYDLPRHLYIFDRRTLTALLDQVGFKVLEIAHFTGHYQVLAGSIRHLTTAIVGPALGRLVYRVIYSPPARVITFPAVKLLAEFNVGPVMTVFARKA